MNLTPLGLRPRSRKATCNSYFNFTYWWGNGISAFYHAIVSYRKGCWLMKQARLYVYANMQFISYTDFIRQQGCGSWEVVKYSGLILHNYTVRNDIISVSLLLYYFSLTRNVSFTRAKVLRFLHTGIYSSPRIVLSTSKNSLHIWIKEWMNTKSKLPSSFCPGLYVMVFLFSPLGELGVAHIVTYNKRTYSSFSRSCHFVMGS